MDCPKDTFPLADYLQEEMEARGWDDGEIYSILADPVDQCAAFLAIYSQEASFILDQRTATVLSRLFDVSSEFFMNLDRARFSI